MLIRIDNYFCVITSSSHFKVIIALKVNDDKDICQLALFKKTHPTQKKFLLIILKADILVPLESNISCKALVGIFCLDF